MGHWEDSERVKRMARSYEIRYGDLVWDAIRTLVKDRGFSVIADFGCGPGLWLRDASKEFNAEYIVGIDASAEMLSYTRSILEKILSNEFINLHQKDLDDISEHEFKQRLDLAFLGYVLHELSDPPEFIKSVYPLMNTSGLVVIFDFISGNKEIFIEQMVSTQGWNSERAEKRYPHMCRHSLDDIQKMLGDAGFSSIQFQVIETTRAVIVGKRSTG